MRAVKRRVRQPLYFIIEMQSVQHMNINLSAIKKSLNAI